MSTPAQQAAWQAFAKAMGEDNLYLEYDSLRAIVDAGLAALTDAAARSTNPSSRSNSNP